MKFEGITWGVLGTYVRTEYPERASIIARNDDRHEFNFNALAKMIGNVPRGCTSVEINLLILKKFFYIC